MVSILVLVDEALEEKEALGYAEDLWFQSLFSWMKRSKPKAGNYYPRREHVSILVLVDEALEACSPNAGDLDSPGFNPCSRG